MQFYAEGGTITKRHPVTSRFAEGASEDFDKITVDDVIKIDHSSHVGNIDKTHLLLKGDIPNGDHYVRVKNSTGALLNINHLGKLYAYAGISSPEITTLTTTSAENVNKIGEHETEIDALITATQTLSTATQTLSADLQTVEITLNNAAPATSTAVENSIVKRDNVNGTVFTTLDTHIISADEAVYLEKNAQLLFSPYHMVNGVLVKKVGWVFRFGRAEEQSDVGDNTQDGLEFISPSTNEIRIQVNEASPTIETVNNKFTNVWVRLRDAQRNAQYEINQFGGQTRIHATLNKPLTPGVATTSGFSGGVTDFVFTLGAAWVFSNVAEHEIILTRTTLNPYMVYIFCFLDSVGANIQSRVFIKRQTNLIEGISVPSEIRCVLAAESPEWGTAICSRDKDRFTSPCSTFHCLDKI